MKKLVSLTLILAALLLVPSDCIKAQTAVAANSMTVLASGKAANSTMFAGRRLAEYTIVYPKDAEAEEGRDVADSLNARFSAMGYGILSVGDDASFKGKYKILITHRAGIGQWLYDITARRGTVTIDCGGAWAFQKAVDVLADYMKTHTVTTSWHKQGTVEGELLFPRLPGVNLRLLDDNIWGYEKKEIPAPWQKAGADPRNAARLPQYVALIKAYMPDVINFQEYKSKMERMLTPYLTDLGYRNVIKIDSNQNNVPIIYNTRTVELLESNYLRYPNTRGWDMGVSKSYSSAVFRLKANGRLFIVIGTHLWWKGEDAQKGSNDEREAEAKLLLKEIDRLRAKYDCPVFVNGDMNCYEDSKAMKAFHAYGLKEDYTLATTFTDDHNGHHICSADDGFSRQSRRKSPTRAGAIDHCLMLNGGSGAEIVGFKCEMAYFTIKLTDHYPNIIDVNLK